MKYLCILSTYLFLLGLTTQAKTNNLDSLKQTTMDYLTASEWKDMEHPNSYLRFDDRMCHSYSIDSLGDISRESKIRYYLSNEYTKRITNTFDTTKVGKIRNGNCIICQRLKKPSPKLFWQGKEIEPIQIIEPSTIKYYILELSDKFLTVEYPFMTGRPIVKSYKAVLPGNHEYEDRTLELLTAHNWKTGDTCIKFSDTDYYTETYHLDVQTGEMTYNGSGGQYYLSGELPEKPPFKFDINKIGRIKGGEYIIMNRKKSNQDIDNNEVPYNAFRIHSITCDSLVISNAYSTSDEGILYRATNSSPKNVPIKMIQ